MANQVQDPSTSPSPQKQSASSSTAASASTAASLARGKACLRCRKRKMRCDGAKPACAQCSRANRTDSCAYDDGRGKTRTQALRERIALLEAEIAVLRDPSSTSSVINQQQIDAILLRDPHITASPPSASGSSSSLNDFLDIDNLDLSGFQTDAFGSLDRPASAQGLIVPPSFDVEDFTYRTAAGGVQRTPRPRPSSGVFGYSANHPLALQSQIQQQSLIFNGQDSASNASSPETVGSGTGSAGASLAPSASLSPYNSPPTGFAPPRTLSPGIFSNSPNLSTISRASSRERKPTIEFGGVATDPDVANALIQLTLSNRSHAGLVLHPTHMHQVARFPYHPSGSIVVLRLAALLFGAYLARGTGIVSQEIEKVLETRVAEEILRSIRSSSALSRGELEIGDGVVDLVEVIQAAVLLVRYLAVNQRSYEARVHLASAVDVAIQLGLHQLGSFENASNRASASSVFNLTPAQDSITLGSRVQLFWELFTLDRVLSVELSLAPLIVDDDCVETRIDTPWPQEMDEYETAIPLESIVGSATLRTFFWQQGMSCNGFGPKALLAKAVAVYSACARTSLHWGMRSPAMPPSAALIASSSPVPANSPTPDSSASNGKSTGSGSGDSASACFLTLETTLARLGSALLPTHQLSAGLPDSERRTQIMLHTILHTAAVKLHIRLAQAGVRESLEKCLRAARAGAALVRCLKETDVRYLDFWIGGCWSTFSSVFSLEQIQASAATPGSPASNWLTADHGAILGAMSRLNTRLASNASFGLSL